MFICTLRFSKFIPFPHTESISSFHSLYSILNTHYCVLIFTLFVFLRSLSAPLAILFLFYFCCFCYFNKHTHMCVIQFCTTNKILGKTLSQASGKWKKHKKFVSKLIKLSRFHQYTL